MSSLDGHLSKADMVVLDYHNLTQANQIKVNSWINTLSVEMKQKILIIRWIYGKAFVG